MASLNLINEVCELRHSRNKGILLKSFDGTTVKQIIIVFHIIK